MFRTIPVTDNSNVLGIAKHTDTVKNSPFKIADVLGTGT